MNKDFNLNKLGTDIRINDNHIDPVDLIKDITSNKNIDQDAFYIVDLEDICNKHIQWITALPRVEPHYAIKCNGDPMLLKLLAYLGAGFDCASKNEIQSILDLGVSPDRIIFANPCKQASYIRYAYNQGVDTMTFDNEAELYKIKDNHPNAKVVLRIITNDADAVCRFSMKFGADMNTSFRLIDLAMKLELNLIGISFHVGSGQMTPSAFSESIQNARILFDYAQDEYGHKMSLLDCGGGYPGSGPDSQELFNEIAREINYSCDKYFPLSANDEENVRIIAEPGRYYAASAFTLCVNVIAKREMKENTEKTFMYYINDGVYASFNCMFYDHVDNFQPILIKDIAESAECYTSSLWGPTCDGLDCVTKKINLPELEIGDFMAFKNMGAYTLAGATPFNGIPLASSIYMASTSTWRTIRNAFLSADSNLTSSTTVEQQHQKQITKQLVAALQRAIMYTIDSQRAGGADNCGVDAGCAVSDTIEEYAALNNDENCFIIC
jgi:diaminopimelate decarboxylase